MSGVLACGPGLTCHAATPTPTATHAAATPATIHRRSVRHCASDRADGVDAATPGDATTALPPSAMARGQAGLRWGGQAVGRSVARVGARKLRATPRACPSASPRAGAACMSLTEGDGSQPGRKHDGPPRSRDPHVRARYALVAHANRMTLTPLTRHGGRWVERYGFSAPALRREREGWRHIAVAQ
jgi:hypothetical protein